MKKIMLYFVDLLRTLKGLGAPMKKLLVAAVVMWASVAWGGTGEGAGGFIIPMRDINNPPRGTQQHKFGLHINIPRFKRTCAVHGSLEDKDVFNIKLGDDVSRHYCLRCLFKFIDSNIGQVEVEPYE